MSFYRQGCRYYFKLCLVVVSCWYCSFSTAGIVVKHNPPVNTIEEALLEDMQRSKTIRKAINVLQQHVTFPKPLVVVYGENPKKASSPGPYYSHGKISIPYRYIFQLRKYLNKRKHIHHYKNVDDLVFASLVFALLHEAGHALIYQYQIPILGREEDVVDNFASYLLLSYFPNGSELLVAAAVVFDLYSKNGKKITDKQMQGEHRLHKQRYFSLLCHLYGHQPESITKKYQGLFSSQQISQCARDYKKLNYGWKTILSGLNKK